MPKLVLNPGQAQEQEFPLPNGATYIGRTQDSDVAILNKSVSRRHARLDVSGTGVRITDLESRHGTFVNGGRIQARVLAGGETIRCGDVAFRFESGASEEVTFEPTMTRAMDSDLLRLSMAELAKARTTGPSGAEQRLQILLKVSQILHAPEGIDRLLETVLDLAFQILDLDRASVLLVDPNDGSLAPRATKHRGVAVPGEPQHSKNIVDWVRQQGVAALFSDTQADPRLLESNSVMLQSIKTSMCAPLKPDDEIIGVLYVDNLTVPDRFTDDDLEMLTAFANQAAMAIHNSRLLERLEDEAVRRSNLSRYFPPSALGQIMAEQEVYLGAREMEVTALFCDISGFTRMSSTMEPTEIVELLNGYFPVMSEIVFRHEGTLEKYIGDALLAVWGAPLSHEDDVDRAIAAAVEMQHALGELNQRSPPSRQLAIHIGLNTGLVAAGNIGSADYLQYVTIGDTTNIAARICDKAPSGEIFISESTMRKAGRIAWSVDPIGPTMVKGKDEPLPLYRLNWHESR